jgi:hypothetical protein
MRKTMTMIGEIIQSTYCTATELPWTMKQRPQYLQRRAGYQLRCATNANINHHLLSSFVTAFALRSSSLAFSQISS